MGRPLFDILEEFPSAEAPARSAVAQRLRRHSEPSVAADPRNRTELRLAEAHAEGMDAGQALARAQCAGEMTALRADFERQLEATKSAFAQAAADTIVTAITEQLGELRTRLVEQMTTAVLPVLRHVLTEAAVRELAGELHEMIADDETVTAEISGPLELLERIRECTLEHRSRSTDRPMPEVRFAVGSTTEVRITVDDAIVESRLFEWIGRTMGAVA